MNSSSTIDNVLPVDDLITSSKVYLKRFKDYIYGSLTKLLKIMLPQANYPISIMASYSVFKRQGFQYQP